ncbi:MAG: ribonuclease Z, partial [Clostridium sp.]|nr:ribonuclease Z [Clostridium sp.]
GNSGRIEPLTIIGPEGIEMVVEYLRVIARYLPYEVKIIENERNINLKMGNEGLEINESTEEKTEIMINTMELDHSAPCIGYNFYVKRNRKFNLEKAIKNDVPKLLWNRLQKGEQSIIYNGKKYTDLMVLGDERKGIKFSYITDSRPLEEIISFIEESDLFICEGTYGSDEDIVKAIKNKHMTFREAATLARKAKCKKMILTHFSPALQEPSLYIKNAKEEFENVVIGYDRTIDSLSFIE